MAGEKRFSTSLFGFKKSDVNSYLENILKEFENRLNSKDLEISNLKNNYEKLKIEYDEVMETVEEAKEVKYKVANVLLAAQEKADKMLEEARKTAMEEKRAYELELEKEREKLVDMKERIRLLREGINITLQTFDKRLETNVEDAFNGMKEDEAIEKIINETFEEAALSETLFQNN